MEKAVGFYWTLPVPWISEPFTRLSSDVEQAAKESRTIRYQMEVVRRWAPRNDYAIVKEGVYLELEPDRAGRTWKQFENGGPPELFTLIKFCQQENATLLYFDFESFLGQRSHLIMRDIIRESRIQHLGIWPDEETLKFNEEDFNLTDHFKSWRNNYELWKNTKPKRSYVAAERAISILNEGITYDAAADMLNREKIRTTGNKEWTGENLRRFLDNYNSNESPSSDQVDGGT